MPSKSQKVMYRRVTKAQRRFVWRTLRKNGEISTFFILGDHALDEAVYCEVMFDENTSGEVPEHAR